MQNQDKAIERLKQVRARLTALDIIVRDYEAEARELVNYLNLNKEQNSAKE